METGKLRMTFDPNTIQHLGIKMYSQLPAAIAELVANAYDADASEVTIALDGENEDKILSVFDNGHGMTFEEVNDFFLKIGRNRRNEHLKNTPLGRTATGKKGLGKLALFGIGGKIEVRTKKVGETTGTMFSLVWEDLKNWDRLKMGPDYTPNFELFDKKTEEHGTEIIISSLKRKTKFSPEELPVSLSKMFNFLDKKFRLFLKIGKEEPIEITNDLKYSSLEQQFEWVLPEIAIKMEDSYTEKANIRGRIITTKKPLKPGQRGITLFANGRMVNLPEFFGVSESSIFFSYATGWLDVDFIDNDEGNETESQDNISTNRQTLDWETDETIPLRNFLQSVISLVHKEWREKRKEENIKDAEKATGINREQWFNTLPKDKAEIIQKALTDVSDPDSEKNYTEIVELALHEIAPEYAERHWRYLCEKISQNEPIQRLYAGKNYFQAASEAAKLYIEEVRRVSGVTTSIEKSDYTLMGNVFGWEDPGKTKTISLTLRSDVIEKDIEQGQRHYSEGVVAGFKNPVTSHATEQELKDRKLFNEKDCLDVLSLISHLLLRLENRQKPAK